jgi:hypothetical protein
VVTIPPTGDFADHSSFANRPDGPEKKMWP